jgi:cysteine-rich repeat protein
MRKMQTSTQPTLLLLLMSAASLGSLGGCSELNREGPLVSCEQLGGGRLNACQDGIIATCESGEVRYQVCPDAKACEASWQSGGAYRCGEADSFPEACGNGVKTGAESCDDGNADDGDLCTAGCLEARCGDGLVQRGVESCDDGNPVSGDGCDTNCTVTACGNGVVTAGEACDDGNRVDGDGCESTCRVTGCGDGEVGTGEGCDDGNVEPGDTCDPNCQAPGCGNGYVASGEGCDDGNLRDGDGCDSNCQPTGCGNGVMTGDERCDDGNTDGGDGCNPDCTITGCGDRLVEGAEACDDGNTVDGDGCDRNCTASACGNGVAAPGEACDDGNTVSGDGCDNNCTATGCGNSVVAGAEVCDDGNRTDGDGCDSNCTATGCGNGVRAGSEGCDDGNGVDGDGCDSNCKPTGCGSGVRTGSEVCDDGNAVDGDGCDSNCTPTGCGNGARDSTEACDDGNLVDGDRCDSNCTVTACGNGVRAGPEDCDDGNTTDNDGCDSNCTPSACGNRVRAGTEGCDDGNGVDGDGCDSNCKPTGCGSGVRTGSEVCDDGNAVDGDGCDSNCTPTGCGNGARDSTEACDDGNLVDGDSCDSNCTVTACGNGVRAGPEDCDDGNRVDNDGCDSNCKPTACGNGVRAGTEGCDDGNTTDNDGCDSNCTVTACGNGVRAGEEVCDDGNTVDGDGCDADCVPSSCGDGVVDEYEDCDDGEGDMVEPRFMLQTAPGVWISTALPYPSATGWVAYGNNETGQGGSSYRVFEVTAGPVEAMFDVATESGYDRLVVRQLSPGAPTMLSDRTSGNATVTLRLEPGIYGVGIRSDSGVIRSGWRLKSVVTFGNGELRRCRPTCQHNRVQKLRRSGSNYDSTRCVLLGGGVVGCWGEGGGGLLGQGNTNDTTDLVAVPLGARVTELALGDDFACALKTGGGVKCWGENGSGELGYGHTRTLGDDEFLADYGDVALGEPAVALSSADSTTCAVLQSGKIRCWGSVSSEQFPVPTGVGYYLGDNELPSSVLPLDLGKPASSVVVGSGGQVCATATDGALFCWGDNSSGKCGVVSRYSYVSAAGRPPVDVGGPVSQVGVGSYHTCALLASGEVRCWGSGPNIGLALGSRTIGDDEAPASVPPVALGGRAVDLVVEGQITCVRLETGRVRCFGDDLYSSGGGLGLGGHAFGIVGDDEHPASRPPVPLAFPANRLYRAGSGEMCAEAPNRALHCWGSASQDRFGGAAPGEFFWSELTAAGAATQLFATAEAETNNAYSSADALSLTVPVGGGAIFPAGDIDYYSVTLAAPGSLRVWTGGLIDGDPCPGDTRIRLYRVVNGTLTELGLDDNSGEDGRCSLIDPDPHPFAANLAAGTYYIRVEEPGNDAAITDFYRLEIEVLP